MSFYWKHLYRRYTKKSKVNEEDNNEELYINFNYIKNLEI